MIDNVPIQGEVKSLYEYNGRLIIGLGDYRVKIWDIRRFSPIKTIDGFWEVRSVVADEDHIYVGSLNEEVQVIDWNTFERIKSIYHPLGILNLHVDDFYVYSTSHNGSVKVLDNSLLEEVKLIEGFHERANCVTSNRTHLFVGDGFMQGGKISIFTKEDFHKVAELDEVNAKRVSAIHAFDNYLISAHGSPPSLVIWNCQNFTKVEELTPFSKECHLICSNSEYVFAASKEGVIQLSKKTLEPMGHYRHENSPIGSISTNEEYLFVGYGVDVIALHQETLEERFKLLGDRKLNLDDETQGEENLEEFEEEKTSKKFKLF